MSAHAKHPQILSISSQAADPTAVFVSVEDSAIGLDSSDRRPNLRAVIRDEAGRHGRGAVDLPIDH